MDAQRQAMVDALVASGSIQSPAVEAAMRAVPRETFVAARKAARAYRDRPMRIGAGQTISAPHMVAIMAEALRIQPGHRVLEIGTGSGYHAAILARLVGPQGRIVSVEVHRRLAERARKALAHVGASNVDVHVADGALGWPASAPFDRIQATCACPAIPRPWQDQLAPGGVLLLPLGWDPARLVRLTKPGQEWVQEDLGGVAFVPLVRPHDKPDPSHD